MEVICQCRHGVFDLMHSRAIQQHINISRLGLQTDIETVAKHPWYSPLFLNG